MRKHFKTILVVILILGIIVFALYSIIKSKINAVGDINSSYTDLAFATYTVKRDDVNSYIRSTGTISSFNIETLDVEVGDTVTSILVSEGQKVEAKQAILKVKDENGKEKTIKSSISGMFFCVENQTSGINYCIYNLDDIGVKIALSEKDIASVSIGQKAKVNITALDKEFDGEVSYVSSLPQNDKFIVRIKIGYTDEVKFGYSTTTSILTMEKQNIISVPYDYINMTDDGRYYVYKEEVKSKLYDTYWGDETPDDIRTYVEVGAITSKNVEILGGLEEGDKIVMLNW